MSAGSDFDAQVAEAPAVLRQLLAWERDLVEQGAEPARAGGQPACSTTASTSDTPEAAVVELPAGATPIDFAYTLHTDLGHRCRGAAVDGQMVPAEHAAARAARPSRSRRQEGGPRSTG